ncbi:MAG: hypothetical protein QXW20_07010 [Ignisphaera sp.]
MRKKVIAIVVIVMTLLSITPLAILYMYCRDIDTNQSPYRKL